MLGSFRTVRLGRVAPQLPVALATSTNVGMLGVGGMAMVAKLWSIGGLALELQRSERTIGRALKTVPPDGELPGRHKAWFLRNAVDALARHEAQSDQSRNRSLTSCTGGPSGALLTQLEQLAHDIDIGMRR